MGKLVRFIINNITENTYRLIIPSISTIIILIGILTFTYVNMNVARNNHVTDGNFPVVSTITEQFTKWSDKLIEGDTSPKRDFSSSINLWKSLHIGEEEQIIPNTSTPRELNLNEDYEKHTPVLTYDSRKFKLDGVEISPFGIRAVNSLQSDVITADFISHLDTMKEHGIQSVKLCVQGGRATEGGNSFFNGYNADGSLKSEFFNRLEDILNATSERGMVLVLQMFYRGQDQELADDEKVLNAVENTVNWLEAGGWKHYWLHVINEWYHNGYDHDQLKTSAGQIEIYDLIKSINPDIITHVSDADGANDGFDADTGLTALNGDVVVEYHQKDSYDDPGVFGSEDRDNAVTHANTTVTNGGYWFWMAGWHQKADAEGWPRWDKGGEGTPESPGVSFIWNTMKSLSQPSYLPFQIYLPMIVAFR
jgi:hypothetical protein